MLGFARVVERTADRLEVRFPPTMTVLAALTLLFMGVLASIPDVWFVRYVFTIPVWLLLAYAIASVRSVTLTLERNADRFTVSRRGLFGQHERETGKLSSIQAAVVETKVQKDTDGSEESTSFRLSLELEDGRRVPMQVNFEFERRSKDALVAEVQTFLGIGRSPNGGTVRAPERV